MTITIKIKTDNAAFEGVGRYLELSRLMEKAKDTVCADERERYLFDSSGNKVGSVTVTGK